jgi:hypothetical protein
MEAFELTFGVEFFVFCDKASWFVVLPVFGAGFDSHQTIVAIQIKGVIPPIQVTKIAKVIFTAIIANLSGRSFFSAMNIGMKNKISPIKTNSFLKIN